MGAMVLVMLVAFAAAGADEPIDFETWFTGQTLRIDLYVAGDKDDTVIYDDELIIEGSWPGTHTKLVDTLNLGGNMVYIHDAASGALLYSRGFDTYFGEWQTTTPAETAQKAMSISLRVPCPKDKVRVTIAQRDRQNRFEQLYSREIDPGYHTVSRERRHADVEVLNLHVPAEPHRVLDILILPDGYTAAETDKLRADAQRTADVILAEQPYDEMTDKIAIRAIVAISADSGPDEPRSGLWRDTAIGASFNSLDLPRYMLTAENKRMRDWAANAPYDALLIMVNTERYGGGGIFGLYTTFAADNEYAPYLITHEMGHSVIGLADEYYTSQVAYNEFYPRGVEPWEPNITALLDPENLKWKHLVGSGTPIPTPEEEAYADVVGAFEGAGYAAEGLYRPAMNCKMFSLDNELDYCPVCMEAVRRLVEFYAEQ